MGSTAQSETGCIQRVLMKHARDAFGGEQKIQTQWQRLDYRAAPDLERAIDEYDRLVDLFEQQGAQILFAPEPGPGTTTIDSIYVRDAAVVTDRGAILCSMAKEARRAEPAYLRDVFEASEIPIAGEITGDGRLEGGDVMWLDPRTLAVGRGYRTNDEGIRQLRELIGDGVDELVVVQLPHWRGPQDVFHLMSMISPIDRDAVLVYSLLLPVPFREWLLHRGMRLVEVANEEFGTMGCNVLALAPGKCLVLENNPETRRRLEAAGVEVVEYAGVEISLKGQGGPTCLTRPLVRQE